MRCYRASVPRQWTLWLLRWLVLFLFTLWRRQGGHDKTQCNIKYIRDYRKGTVRKTTFRRVKAILRANGKPAVHSLLWYVNWWNRENGLHSSLRNTILMLQISQNGGYEPHSGSQWSKRERNTDSVESSQASAGRCTATQTCLDIAQVVTHMTCVYRCTLYNSIL